MKDFISPSTRFEQLEKDTMPSPSKLITVQSTATWTILFFILTTAFSLVLFPGCKRRSPQLIQAENGILDLSGWDFEKQGPVRLDGQWEFYWETLLEPGDFPREGETTKTIRLPGLWKDTSFAGARLPPVGYGTYRLTVKGLGTGRDKPDTLFVLGFLSVCEIRVNGVPAAATGRVGRNRNDEIPGAHAVFARFEPTGPSLEILLQVSNFHNAQGGIKTPIWLGNDRQVRLMMTRKWVLSGILGGTLLTMGLFHLALFLIRRKETVNLYFGVFCSLWAIQTLFGVGGGCLMSYLFPSLAWRITIDLSILLFGAAPPLLVMFYHLLFPHKYSNRVNRIYQMLGGICLIYVVSTPPNAFDPPILFFALVTQSAMFYLFILFARNLVRGNKSALILSPGYLILALSWANNILWDLQLIQSINLVPYGTFLFILFHSFFITLRFFRAFSTIDTLNGKLVDLLEKRQQSLKLTERRLSSMLDHIGHAVLAVNPALEIAYANHHFEQLTGHPPGNILGRAVSDLFPGALDANTPDLETALCQSDESSGTVHYSGVAVQHADESVLHLDLSLSILDLSGDDLGFLILKQHLPGKEKSLVPVGEDPIIQLKADRERMEKVLDLVDRNSPKLPPGKLDVNVEKRDLGHCIMTGACDLWSSTTGQSKADLAEQSGLWTVYINRDGWARTQTLDKYLDLHTLPTRPRWKNIVSTADFVLALCKDATPEKHALEQKLARLKSLLFN